MHHGLLYQLKIFYREHRASIVACFVIVVAGVAWYETRPPVLTDPIKIAAHQASVAAIIARGDLNACNDMKAIIGDINYYAVCVNNVAHDLAVKNLDPTYCERLDNQLFDREQCRQEIASRIAAKENNVEGCAALADQTARAECEITYWMGRAIKENATKLCNNIATASSQTTCKDRVLVEALAKGENISCDAFSDVLRPDCEYFKKSLKVSVADIRTFCAGIGNIILQRACTTRTQ